MKLLSDEGPLTHDELSSRTGLEWYEAQEVIRDLRNQGSVSITLDRRYQVENSDELIG